VNCVNYCLLMLYHHRQPPLLIWCLDPWYDIAYISYIHSSLNDDIVGVANGIILLLGLGDSEVSVVVNLLVVIALSVSALWVCTLRVLGCGLLHTSLVLYVTHLIIRVGRGPEPPRVGLESSGSPGRLTSKLLC
jgi:hypothetical protein